MIQIAKIEIKGTSDAGAFGGSFSFVAGLQVISAPNHFGKSLAANAISWCLGLEGMFGLKDNDPSLFPIAVRDVIDLNGILDVPVQSSEAALTLSRESNVQIRLTRAIKGDPSEVLLEEITGAGEVLKTSRLFVRKQTMKDEHAGLQAFLFSWMGWPRVPVMTIKGVPGEIYLENLAPLFFIDQREGWTDIQALQVHRYGLQQISEVAVEYLLGALDALEARFSRQTTVAQEAQLKAEAEALAQQVIALFAKEGWVLNWSPHGSVADIARRWSAPNLVDIAKKEFGFDLSTEQMQLKRKAEALRSQLSKGALDPMNAGPASDASQNVVDLKAKRHQLRDELRIIRAQVQEQRELAESLEHRIASAKDTLRLKVAGIGRLETVECPSCHRSLDPSTFDLTAQSAASVEAHIEALMRDRILMLGNIDSATNQMTRLAAELSRTEDQLRSAERTLALVNSAVDSIREQLTKTAMDIASVEQEIEKNGVFANELEALQEAIDKWIAEVGELTMPKDITADMTYRRSVFGENLKKLLISLGHSAVTEHPESSIYLDDQYTPYLGNRRLRSLGSASDQPRLIAAYVLALAEAAIRVGGLHPEFVILDEPLQQNPDPKHRQLFIDFLASDAAQ